MNCKYFFGIFILCIIIIIHADRETKIFVNIIEIYFVIVNFL